MSQINQIQEELRQIEGGRFQTLANQYLYRRYSLNNIIELGSQCGTDKTTTGVAYRTKCVSILGASAQVDAPFSAV